MFQIKNSLKNNSYHELQTCIKTRKKTFMASIPCACIEKLIVIKLGLAR